MNTSDTLTLIAELRAMREKLTDFEIALRSNGAGVANQTPAGRSTKEAVASYLATDPGISNADLIAALVPAGHNEATIRSEATRQRTVPMRPGRQPLSATSSEPAMPLAEHHVTPMAPHASHNGVTLGGERWMRGLCHAAWLTFDALTPVGGPATSLADAIAVGKRQGLNEGNMRVEYYNWRRFNGFA